LLFVNGKTNFFKYQAYAENIIFGIIFNWC